MYSSIEYNLCFIDTITKCLDKGKKYLDYYNYSHCAEWITEETGKINSRIENRMKRVEEFPEGSLKKIIAVKAIEKDQKSLAQIGNIEKNLCSPR